jgi:hypothetical protein
MLKLFKKQKTIKEELETSKEQKQTKDDILISVSEQQTIQICNSIPEFTNWNKNRPPDSSRINELKEYYITEKIKIIPGIIYAWDNDNQLQIYDGIHRLLAAKELLEENENIQYTFLMCIYTTQDEDLIIKDFKAINKSCPVPTLYTDEQNELSLIKRVVCENVVSELCKRYKEFVSPSRKPYRYNFNRDVVLEWLSEFEMNWNVKNLSNIIIQELQGLNYFAKDYVHRNSITTPKKCNFHNFYLWYLDKSFIRNKIESSIKNYN